MVKLRFYLFISSYSFHPLSKSNDKLTYTFIIFFQCDGGNAVGTGASNIIKAGKRLQSSLPDLGPAVSGIVAGGHGHRLSISPVPSNPATTAAAVIANTSEAEQPEPNTTDSLNTVASLTTSSDVNTLSANKSPPKLSITQTTSVPTSPCCKYSIMIFYYLYLLVKLISLYL